MAYLSNKEASLLQALVHVGPVGWLNQLLAGIHAVDTGRVLLHHHPRSRILQHRVHIVQFWYDFVVMTLFHHIVIIKQCELYTLIVERSPIPGNITSLLPCTVTSAQLYYYTAAKVSQLHSIHRQNKLVQYLQHTAQSAFLGQPSYPGLFPVFQCCTLMSSCFSACKIEKLGKGLGMRLSLDHSDFGSLPYQLYNVTHLSVIRPNLVA